MKNIGVVFNLYIITEQKAKRRGAIKNIKFGLKKPMKNIVVEDVLVDLKEKNVPKSVHVLVAKDSDDK